jgi:orotate phosphoribosyltransferase
VSEAAARAAAILEARGAVIRDSHVVYTSGRHGSAYVDKDAIYPDTAAIAELCGLMADAARPLGADVVCGPALGGIILSQWVGHHLGLPAVYAEKDESGMVLRRGYDRLVRGRRVLVVEDVLNTGGSVEKTIAAVRAAGGEVVGASALCNRGTVTAADLGAPVLQALLAVRLDSWPAEACPLCRDGVAVNAEVGKGREFLAARPAAP